MHENIQGILLPETSGLTSSEFASVLATSGTTGAEGESIGNSWKFSHLAEAFSTQWSDAALAARDATARKSEAVVVVVDNFDLSGLSEAASRVENAISWNGTDPQIVEYEDDDDDYYEEDVDWYTGDCDDELDETAYTVMVIWTTLMRLHLKRMHRQVAVLKKHVSFWLASRVPEGIFLLVLVVLTVWFSHPLIENLQSLVAKARRIRGKEISLLRKVENRQAWVHLAFCQNHRPHVLSPVLRCPRSVRPKLAQLVVDWAVQCPIHRVMVPLSKKSNKIKTRRTSKTLLRFQSRV